MANPSQPSKKTFTMESITAEPPRYLWEPYLRRGNLNIIRGDGGAGKTMLAVAIAAAVTQGTQPAGMPGFLDINGSGNVFVLSNEDDFGELRHDLMLALDPVRFSQSIGIDPDPWQAEVLRHEGKRMLLNCCRQSGKSTTTATKALHQALFFPRSLVLCAAPSLRQSQELFKKIRGDINAMKDPPRLIEDNQLSLTIGNYSRIKAINWRTHETRS